MVRPICACSNSASSIVDLRLLIQEFLIGVLLQRGVLKIPRCAFHLSLFELDLLSVSI